MQRAVGKACLLGSVRTVRRRPIGQTRDPSVPTQVERTAAGFGAAGAAGLLTESGLAPLVWRSGRPVFVRKGIEQEASPAQVQDLRRFAADLKHCLDPSVS